MPEINEPVDVWVFFKGTKIEPWCFFWKGRRIKIDQINLVHSSVNGLSKVYHFSVSAHGNFYRLGFYLQKLKWYLEAVEEE